MPYMQPFCTNGNRKWVQFGSKVRLTKIRTKTCYVHFFKDTLNKKAVNPSSNLMKITYQPWISLNMSAVAQKLNESLKTNNISCLFFRKEDYLLGGKSNFCWNVTSLEEGLVADLPPKGPQIQSAPEGGRKTMTIMIMMMMKMMMMKMMSMTMTMMTMMIIMGFLHPIFFVGI